jgi:hypothetical protein
MIKHVVLFKFKEDLSLSTKEEKITQIQTGLLELKNTIGELKSIEVGLNSNPHEEYDLALITTFDSYDALATYAQHPEHLKVAEWIREILEKRACVDFEIHK